MTEVYLVRPSLYSQAFQSWRAPPGIWIPNIPTTTAAQAMSTLNMDVGGPGHYLTGGGLIRHGGAVYMLTAPDMISFGGWRACTASHGGKKHRRSTMEGGSSSSGSSRGASSLSPPSASRRSGGSVSTSSSKAKTSSSSSRSDPHSACQQLHNSQEPFRTQQQQMLQFSSGATPDIVGALGHVVHFSTQYGFALVLLDPSALYLLDSYSSSSSTSTSAGTAGGGAHDTALGRAIPLSDLRRWIDEPELTDFVEFSASSGDEDTGLVVGLSEYCFFHIQSGSTAGSSSSRRSSTASSTGGSVMTTKLLAVQTSSYAVAPADCGLWVRRSVASERPFLLGHVVGLVPVAAADGEYEGGGGGGGTGAVMLVMPFVGFAAEVERVISSGRFEFL